MIGGIWIFLPDVTPLLSHSQRVMCLAKESLYISPKIKHDLKWKWIYETALLHFRPSTGILGPAFFTLMVRVLPPLRHL